MDAAATIQYLTDRNALRDLMARYYQAVDRRDFDTVAACFTEDAYVHFRLDQRGTTGAETRGREAILGFIRGVARYSVTTHFMGNHLAEINGDDAEVETYAIAHHRDDSAKPPRYTAIALRYIDRMVRRHNGWLIAHRVMVADWRRDDAALPAP